MTCEEALVLVHALADGELDVVHAREVEAHIAGCPRCAAEFAAAREMRQVLRAEPLLQNTAADYAPKPDYRPLTKFENRGLKLGHGVWDLVFRRA